MRDRILLFTGGLDSTAAWHLLGQPERLWVNLDPSSPPTDLRWSSRPIRGDDGVLRIRAPWPAPTHPDGHIPLRNLHLVSVGALFGNEVILGAVKGESSPDKSDRFLHIAGKAITSAAQHREVRIVAPLKRYTKRQLVRRLLSELGTKRGREVVAQTHSCYLAETERCGRCMACFRRWVALSLNGIHEDHDAPPWAWKPPSWEQRFAYLKDAPPREWPGIIQTNAEAVLALRKSP